MTKEYDKEFFCVNLNNAVALVPKITLFLKKLKRKKGKERKIIIPDDLHHRKGKTKMICLACLWGVNLFRLDFFYAVATILCPYLARSLI